MKQPLIIGLMALLLISVAAAESCFTAVSVPQAAKNYWKAVTYTSIKDANYDDWLSKPNNPTDSVTIGPGYAYTMRIDSKCFDGYLLGNKDSTGATSSDINIQKRDMDYFTSNFLANKVYTISIKESDSVSTRTVNDITTATIGGINYLSLPPSFDEDYKHPEVKAITEQVCDPNLKITAQLDNIKLALWKDITYTSGVVACNDHNIVDCVLEQGVGDNIHYATTFLVIARKCGVPVRIAHGISEATFDGVDQYFPRDKSHYWIEYYDQEWYNLEVTPAGSSLPENIEINCYDGIDNDDNGDVDCWDEACSDDQVCNGWASTNTFDNQYSTDLTSLPNAYSINNLTIGNTNGKITWVNQALDLRGVTIETAVNIAPNLININQLVPSLNAPATAELYNIKGNNPQIMKNNIPCTQCELIDYSLNTIEFTIPGTGRYAISFANQTNTSINQTIVPSADQTIIDKYWGKIKSTYNKLTNLAKIVILIIVIGGIWIIRRRQRKQYYGRYR